MPRRRVRRAQRVPTNAFLRGQSVLTVAQFLAKGLHFLVVCFRQKCRLQFIAACFEFGEIFFEGFEFKALFVAQSGRIVPFDFDGLWRRNVSFGSRLGRVCALGFFTPHGAVLGIVAGVVSHGGLAIFPEHPNVVHQLVHEIAVV